MKRWPEWIDLIIHEKNEGYGIKSISIVGCTMNNAMMVGICYIIHQHKQHYDHHATHYIEHHAPRTKNDMLATMAYPVTQFHSHEIRQRYPLIKLPVSKPAKHN